VSATGIASRQDEYEPPWSVAARALSLVTLSVGAMGAIAMAAWVAFATVDPSGPISLMCGSAWDVVVVGLMIPVPVGAIVGLLCSPVVLLCLYRKPLRWAVPIVYLPSLGAVVGYALVTPLLFGGEPGLYLSSAGVAVVAILTFAFLVRALLPDNVRKARRCPTCGYDLRGSAGPACSECGSAIRGDVVQHPGV
jgi:hypothetical protein